MRNTQNTRRGAMLPFVAVVIVILFVAAALSIDIAHIHMVRAELRTATDAAARGGAEALGRLQDEDAAIDAAIETAALNLVAGKPLIVDRSEIELGRNQVNTNGRFEFVAGLRPANAIRVVGNRGAGSRSGSVPMLFGPLFGVTEFQPVQVATATRLDRDIALVLDVSGSMRSFGRFEALKNGLAVFLNELQISDEEERVSLTVYSTKSRKKVDMTADLELIQSKFDEESANGFTAIGEGLKDGLKSLTKDSGSRPFAAKTIILMTDGNHNTGISPALVAPNVRAEGAVCHTITFSRGANQTLMKQVADITGGVHLHANTNQQLIDSFREIALTLPVLLTE